jgi:hypothetical protein
LPLLFYLKEKKVFCRARRDCRALLVFQSDTAWSDSSAGFGTAYSVVQSAQCLCRVRNHDGIASTALQICLAVYLFVMLQRSYAASRWYCAVTALTIAWYFVLFVWLYRFLLFTVTRSVV